MSQKMEQTDARDEILDRAATQIRESEPNPAVVARAADRVWKNLGGQAAPGQTPIVAHDDSRDDFPLPDNVVDLASRRATRNRWWALAAVLIAAVGIGNLLVGELWNQGPSATVKTVDAQLFRVTDTAQIPIAAGDAVQEGDVIRTSRDGGAVVRLNDGSLVELAPRSEMSIDESRKGTTLELGHGNIIVEAAKQRNRHLMVQTDDCLVSVVGTIFSVNHGTKGSKVSVIEGEVNVAHGDAKDVLLPGQQVTTHRLLARTKVADEIAWSHNVDDYLKILKQYSDLQEELHQALSTDLRYSSDLLDLMPENTVLYAASPNLAEAVSRTHQVLKQRLDENPELAEWWASEAAGEFQEHVDEIVQVFEAFGSFLGDELATGGYLDGDKLGGVVALAEIDDAAGLRAYIESKLDELTAEHPEAHFDGLIFVEDPASVVGQNDDLFIWLHDSYAVATNSGDQLQRVAALITEGGTNPFVGSDFHQSIAELYTEGAEYLVAADLNGFLTLTDHGEDADAHAQRLSDLGIDSIRHLILEQKSRQHASEHRAVVTFDEPREGLASWLAAPSPMAGLRFVSPDAKLVTAIVFKDPESMLDDILTFTGGDDEGLAQVEEKYGLSLREDFAAALGGEVVLALDGPILPTPSWKAILEVYDPARIQWTFEQALAGINRHLAEEGSTETLTLEQTDIGGRTYYSLPLGKVTLHYTFVEGYLLMGASPALLDQAVRYRDAGQSITESAKFQALLPQDGRNNFSALVYQDLSSVMQAMAEKLGGGILTEEQQAQLEALKNESGGPMLGYAYGDDQRITMAAGTRGNFLTSVLLRVLGMKNPAGFEALLGDLIDVG